MSTKPQTNQSSKKAYRPPVVVKYGDVRTLTQAGTSGSSEGSSGTGVMKPGSDRKLKENIVKIGTHPLGFGLYLFDYKSAYREPAGRGRQFGVMADEVEWIVPNAVSVHPDGYKVVDYDMLGISRVPH
jgi:hypothetical protein